MAKKASKKSSDKTLRLTAEEMYGEEIDALIKADKGDCPTGWKMSPKSVLTYICGGKCGKLDIQPKYIGNQRIVEIAISTLITDRALLLIGEPGTAKSWLSEHLVAAINGDSTKVVQGTAGTTEEQIRYTWNYAMLIAKGPSDEALIKSPIFRAMEEGSIARFEEITRCASEVQDAMISLLSEKRIAVPELEKEVAAEKGFSLIATANTRDRGVNDKDAIEKIVTIFRELREGQTLDGKAKVKSPSGVLSTAEAISMLTNSMALAGNFGSGSVEASDLAAGLQGSIVKNEEKDAVVWQEYLKNVVKKRGAKWRALFDACSEHNS